MAAADLVGQFLLGESLFLPYYRRSVFTPGAKVEFGGKW